MSETMSGKVHKKYPQTPPTRPTSSFHEIHSISEISCKLTSLSLGRIESPRLSSLMRADVALSRLYPHCCMRVLIPPDTALTKDAFAFVIDSWQGIVELFILLLLIEYMSFVALCCRWN